MMYVDMFNNKNNETNITIPASYVKHINFMNFEDLNNQTNPIYINFVRDPVDRVISWYYYRRQGWYLLKYEKIQKKYILHSSELTSNPGLLKMPYEKCVQKKLPECQYISGNSVHFGKFGGSHFSQVSTGLILGAGHTQSKIFQIYFDFRSLSFVACQMNVTYSKTKKHFISLKGIVTKLHIYGINKKFTKSVIDIIWDFQHYLSSSLHLQNL